MTEDRMWVGVGPDPDFEIRRKSGPISTVGAKTIDLAQIREVVKQLLTELSGVDLSPEAHRLLARLAESLSSAPPSTPPPDAVDEAAGKSAWVVPDSEFHEAPKPREVLRGLRNFETATKAVPRIFRELQLARLQ